MRRLCDILNTWVILGISIVLTFTGCGGVLPWHRAQTLTLLYTNNTNGLLEACG